MERRSWGESPMTVGSTRGAGSVAVEVLARAGVRRFYTVPGESFLEVLDAVEEHPALSLVSTRHESGASFMAEADAKLTGVPAVAMATAASAPRTWPSGCTPRCRTPWSSCSGTSRRISWAEKRSRRWTSRLSTPRSPSGRHGPQRRPPGGVRREGPAHRHLRPPRAGDARLACRHPRRGGPGSPEHGPATSARPAPTRRRSSTSPAFWNRLSPVVIAGEGAGGARQELISFAEAFDAGVYAAFRRQDVFPNEHPCTWGTTLGTPPEILRALERRTWCSSRAPASTR